METLRGTAEKVRNTVSVSGGGDRNSTVTTTHIALFQINNRQIKVSSTEPVLIEEGDEVVIAGSVRRGLFEALAYRNVTTGITGNQAYVVNLILGIIFPAAAVGFFTSFMRSGFFSAGFGIPGMLPAAVSAIFFITGIYILFTGFRTMKAKNMVDQAGF